MNQQWVCVFHVADVDDNSKDGLKSLGQTCFSLIDGEVNHCLIQYLKIKGVTTHYITFLSQPLCKRLFSV